MEETKNCCGAERSTKYCAECGKKLGEESPLDSFLEHASKVARRYKRQAEKLKQEAEHSEVPRWHLVQQGKAERAYAKWSGWESAVRKLMADGEGE